MITPAQEPSGASRERDELSTTVAALAAENASLRAELARRRLLDLATGVLIARLVAPPAEAAEHLSRLARETGVGAEELAADIVNGVTGTITVTAPPATGNDTAPGDEGPAETRRSRRAATAAEARHTVNE
ncbi:ANTAR domain-containing protein, partial [Streptomyces sp. NPDC057638]|uniref:ANTAR domain-containing protein n=1 Tax=Streptomyces sp. NPDC057638 TaxID=3346190 RepID=UPI0036A4D631